jgi:hypothetical protein
MAIPTLAQGLLPLLDAVRGIPGTLGFRPISVTVRVVTWTGTKPGQGAQSYVDTPLLVGNGTQNPRVIQVTDKDALASNSLYTNQAVKVGPLTPAFAASLGSPGGGVTAAQLNPPLAAAGSTTEIFFKLSGSGYQFPVWFKRVSDEVMRPTQYFVVLERSGNQQPGGAP